MLRVTYEAVNHLAPGRLAWIDEGRGRLRVEVDKTAPLEDVVRQLNIEFDELMAEGNWFQLWRGEIISRHTPGAPISVRFILGLCRYQPPDTAAVLEDRGLVRVHVDPALNTEEFAVAMNFGAKELLAGGQWFQLHAGEIITMDPPGYLAA
ncbi:hypothetical protein GCM10010293_39840 [Streptomyces griseoflavus]|uniref:hypothetical protein n=1 Tax=Streptomyces griseoflavus TaxID=35619 RepID=UPI00167E082C|nr:hypothetical protein [Streptomyces griseoflavus]GGV36524.1 hypothetical protein GCM10010293_39840 [Streptomyces griseoflavus]